MAPRGSTKVKLNRRAVSQIQLILADGVLNVGKHLVEATQPPDEPPLGEGLVRHGGTIVYVGSRKVGEWSIDGSTVKKPRALKLAKDQIVGGVGFDRPARFDEAGTIHQPARPFFAPTVRANLGRIAGWMAQATMYRLKRSGVI